jgi:1-aminocyclopropane-1-carboxylate deaminase/D-cysteine desulfhydrase-like pyridoxal-dependent ACC family enzyme
MKRDDELGFALGGNKTRKLEYELAHAQNMRAHKIVTFGGLQSNHARLTAANALRLGMEPHLFYFSKRPASLQGNLLLNQIMGAHLHFVPFGKGGDGNATIESTIRLVKLVAFAYVGAHYFVPVGGHSVRGALGYVRAAFELDEQARALGIQDAQVIVAAGTGGTLAGLMAGLALHKSALRVTAIDVGGLWKNCRLSIAHLASETCARLGERVTFQAQDVPLIEARYVGERYAVMTAECRTAIEMLARQEGIFLDPVYTGKAFAGMLDLIERDELKRDAPIIFLHTGGTPGLFAYADELVERLDFTL